MWKVLKLAALFLCFRALLLPVALQAQSVTPAFLNTPCPVTFPEQYEVTCGLVTVPQDRQHPDERTLQLAVAVFAAQSITPAPDPLIFLDGGPGTRTLDSFASGLGNLLERINHNRDVILFDYRGIGHSEPALTCPEAAAAKDDWITACQARLANAGVDVTDFTTRDNAADAAVIIKALGYTQYNIWGGSYGSSVAMALLRDHPTNIRAAIVTALQPPQADLQAATPQHILQTLSAINALCQADAACSTAYPDDLAQQLAAVVARLDADPVPVPTARGGGSLEGIDVLAALAELLKDEQNIPIIPGLMAELYAEQYDRIFPYANALAASAIPPQPFGAWLSMRCTDSILATSSQAMAAAIAGMDPAIGAAILRLHEQQIDWCHTWGARVPNAADRAAAVTDTPILIISGALDPFSSAAWLDTTLATLPNGQGFMLPYHMHYVIQHPCAAALLVNFIEHPTADIADDCLEDMPVPGFRIK